MVLWTPNPKTVDPVKLCDRCGGIDRKHYAADHRDMRRYFSFHRACCCAALDCNSLCFSITVSGVDAAICTACWASGFVGSRISVVAVDGTYSVTGSAGSPWGASTANITNGITRLNYTTPDCSTTPSPSPTSPPVSIAGTCSISPDTLTLTAATIWGGSGNKAFTWSGSTTIPATVNNQNGACSSQSIVSSGGSISVSQVDCP